jgi:hypothetical protein
VRYDGVERFDVLPLLVATGGAIAATQPIRTLVRDKEITRHLPTVRR